ncbi:hypothetical protein Gpo141_00014207, partial [Globisporangium polare]
VAAMRSQFHCEGFQVIPALVERFFREHDA